MVLTSTALDTILVSMPAADQLLRRLFSNWIRGHIVVSGLSEEALARQLGLSEDWLAALEQGDPAGDLTWIQGWALIELLGADPDAVGSLLLEAVRLSQEMMPSGSWPASGAPLAPNDGTTAGRGGVCKDVRR